jgi:hypothetical protein
MAILQAHPLCSNVRVIETQEFSPKQFFFKIRTNLPEKYKLQVRLYFNQDHVDYAYQLFSDVPLLRWDNKEEFDYLESYPHHYHDELGNVKASPLQGDPVKDIELVLQKVSAFLSRERT